MPSTNGVSFLGQSSAQQTRLRSMQLSLAELQRQLTTQKKHETYSGVGFDSLTLQKYRMEKGRVESYLGNITDVTTRINLMSNSMTRASDVGRSLIESIETEVREGNIDLETIKTLARDNLAFLRDLVNTNIVGRYLFAGSDSKVPPYTNSNGTDTAMQAEVANWLNGTQTSSQLLTSITGYNPTQLGFDPALGSSGSVSIRIEETTEIDYTVMGNSNGFDDIMRALSFIANLELPDPATDVATLSQFHDVLEGITAIAKRGIDTLDAANTTLGSKFNLITSIQETHTQDMALYDKLIGDIENADTTETVTKIQALQTQMTASYEVTRIVSQLSLVNFL